MQTPANANTGSWTTIDPDAGSPTPRHETAFVQVGSKFYLLGGRGNKAVEVYDPAGRTWSSNQKPPLQLHHFQAVGLDGLLYVIGAFSGGCCSESPVENVYIYDPMDDEWIVGPQIPSDRQRGSAGAVVYNDQIYLIAGIRVGHQSGWVAWTDRYDPTTNSWQPLNDAPRARDHFHAAVASDRIYAIGGRRSGADGIFNATVPEVDVYDLSTGEWSTLPNDLPTKRAGTMSAVLGNEVIVIGGESGGQSEAHSQTEALNIATNEWRTLAALNEDRHGSQAIVSNGGIYIAGGSGGRGGGPELASLEAFYFTAPTLPDGETLVKSSLVPSVSAVDIGDVAIGDVQFFDLTLQNRNGNQAIVLQDLRVTGSNAFEVTAPHTMPFVIAPDDSAAVQIEFAPTAIETHAAQLAIDHSGATGETAVTLAGSGVNDITLNTAPTVVNPISDFSVDEDSPATSFDLTSVFGDAEESSSDLIFTVTANSNPALTLASVANSTLLLAYFPNATGNATVFVRATDSLGLFAEEGFTVSVINVNDPPTLSQVENLTMTEGQLLTVNVSAFDRDGDTLTFGLTTEPQWDRARLVDHGDGSAELTFRADRGDAGTYVNTLTVADPDGLTATSRFSVTVHETNRAPTLSALPEVNISEGQLFTLTVSAQDLDGDAITIGGENLPSFVSIVDHGNGKASVLISPTYNDAGQYSAVLRATDSTNRSDEKTLLITILNSNRRPLWNSFSNQFAVSGERFLLTVSATDPDGDSLTLSLEDPPADLQFTELGDGRARLKWTPTPADVGIHSMTLRAEDSRGLATTRNLVLTVVASNQPPTLEPLEDVVIQEGTTLTLTIQASDGDGQPLVLSAENLPPFAALTNVSGGDARLVFAPDFTQSGIYSSTVVVTDSIGVSTRQTLSIEVVNVNRNPVLSSIDSLTLTVGTILTMTLGAADLDGDELSITATGLPSATTLTKLDAQQAQLIWKGDVPAGRYEVTIRAEDSGGLFAEESFVLTVLFAAEPKAPQPIDRSVIDLSSGQLSTVTLTYVDPNGDQITLQAQNVPAGATFTDLGNGRGELVWRPAETSVGVHTFLITAIDATGLFSEQLIRLNVVESPVGAEGRQWYFPLFY